jgi:hypothetical protein
MRPSVRSNRIALGRPGDHDVFRNALVRWTDFIGPLVVLVVITVGYQLASNPAVLRTMNANFNATVIVLGLGIAGAGLRALIGLGVTFGLAKGTVAPERLAPGLLAYAWMQAALVAPLMIVGHTMSTGGGPTWMIVTFGLGLLLFIIVGATRVMRVAFGLSSAAWGGVLAFAGMWYRTRSTASFRGDPGSAGRHLPAQTSDVPAPVAICSHLG